MQTWRDRNLRSVVTPLAAAAVATGLCAGLMLPAEAQLPGQLGGALGALQGGSHAGLSGPLPSVGQAGLGNTAGVLQYCVRNNYLGGGSGASAVQQSLVGKLGGAQHSTQDSGFRAGSSGLLQTGNGQSFALGGEGGGSGVKAQVTHKVCNMVLQHAKSLL